MTPRRLLAYLWSLIHITFCIAVQYIVVVLSHTFFEFEYFFLNKENGLSLAVKLCKLQQRRREVQDIAFMAILLVALHEM